MRVLLLCVVLLRLHLQRVLRLGDRCLRALRRPGCSCRAPAGVLTRLGGTLGHRHALDRLDQLFLLVLLLLRAALGLLRAGVELPSLGLGSSLDDLLEQREPEDLLGRAGVLLVDRGGETRLGVRGRETDERLERTGRERGSLRMASVDPSRVSRRTLFWFAAMSSFLKLE